MLKHLAKSMVLKCIEGDIKYESYLPSLPVLGHSTYFVSGYMTLDIIMVKDHSDSERGNPLLPHGLLFLIAARVLLYASSHRQDKTYHSLCYTSCGALVGTRSMLSGSTMKNRSNNPLHHEGMLLPQSYISLLPLHSVVAIF